MTQSCLQTTEKAPPSAGHDSIDLLVLSDHIQPGHPVWGKLADCGFNLHLIFKDKPPKLIRDKSIVVVDGMHETILEWIDYLIKYHNDLKGIPRILLTLEEDYLQYTKMNLFRCDAYIDINPNDQQSMEQAAKTLRACLELKPVVYEDRMGWEDVSRKLAEKLIQDKRYTEIFGQLIGLSPTIKEYEFTLKSVLKQITKIFNVPIASVFVKEDGFIYTLVDKPVSKKYLNHQTAEIRKLLDDEKDCEEISEVIWGRNLLIREQSEIDGQSSFMVHTLKSKGISLGYWAMPGRMEGDEYDKFFLTMISQQISLLVNYSWLYKKQSQTVQDNFQRLGAINEVCRLFADVDGTDFGLQFLLILLEHLSADMGLLILVDDNGIITKSHGMGLPQNCVDWLLGSESGLPWHEVFFGYETKTGNLKLPSMAGLLNQLPLSFVGLPLAGVQGNIGVIFIFFKNEFNDENDFLPFMRTMAILAGTHFENIDLYQQSIEKRIIEEQINIAREIQQELLPKHTPTMRDFEIAAESCPATQVGGDLYDFVDLADGNQAIVIGDVSGKGIAASQLMAMTKSLLKFHLKRHGDLATVMGDINNYLEDETPTEKYVTVQALLLNEQKKKIIMVNGGHEFLLVYRAETQKFEEIRGDGLPLGIIHDTEFKTIETPYSSGDIFLMFTDGLTEAMNPEREMFGVERVKEIIRTMSKHHPKDILDEFYRAIWKHAAGHSLHDDTTIVVIKAK